MTNEHATSREDADRRFENCESKDPLPNIPPALLNSADIDDYVRLTGMVYPFNTSVEDPKLKSASYEVDFLGDLHLHDPAAGYKKYVIKLGEPYSLPKNSISFLFLETEFRLPDYIGARFNLRITHVHAGLLLGTGPLVDPGFAGRLLIPLHNLTSDDYVIKGGEGLIWVEFTKLSPNRRWDTNSVREGDFRGFPARARHGTAEKYFEKALAGRKGLNSSPIVVSGEVRPARSSIPGEVQSAKKAADDAQAEVKRLKKWAIGGGLGFVISLGAALLSVYSLILGANKNVGDASKAISDYRNHQKQIDDALSEIRKQDAQVDMHLRGVDEALKGLGDRYEVLSSRQGSPPPKR